MTKRPFKVERFLDLQEVDVLNCSEILDVLIIEAVIWHT